MARSKLSRETSSTDRGRRHAVELLEERRLLTGVPSLQVLPGSIAGIVHSDNVQRDHRWEPGETGVANAVLELLNDKQVVEATAVTDDAGRYHFDDVWPGIYSIRAAQPTTSLDTGVGLSEQIDVISGTNLVGYNFSEFPLDSAAAALATVAKAEPSASLSVEAFPLVSSPPRVAAPRVNDSIVAREEYIPNSVDIENYGWRLSLLNVPAARASASASPAARRLHQASWQAGQIRGGMWLLGTDKGQADFGLEGATPLLGDFNGDGKSELALYLAGEWLIDINGNGSWDEDDLSLQLGSSRDQPVVGDWNGDGRDDIGIFGPQQNADSRVPRADDASAKATRAVTGPNAPRLGVGLATAIDQVFSLGAAGDQPIAGDFNGDGRDSSGVFRRGAWRIDLDGDGKATAAERNIKFGDPNGLPIVGDFDGDGIDEIGIFQNGQWIIDSNNNGEVDAQDQVLELGAAGDLPIVGDFNGDGIDEPGIYRSGPAARVTRTP